MVIYYGYRYVSDYLYERAENRANKIALVTAKVWTATARFRKDPERFTSYRDSLLKAENVTAEKIFEHLKRFEDRSEVTMEFTRKVHWFVDSLTSIEDSLLREAAQKATDTALTFNSLKN